MNEQIKEIMGKTLDKHFSHTWTVMDYEDVSKFAEKFAKLIIQECINCCDEVANEADAMKDSKFVTDAGRMLHEGMWGGATNSAVTIKNRFGVE